MAVRNFSNAEAEFLEFTIGKSKKVHRLPLASHMPLDMLRAVGRAAAIPDEAERAAASIDAELDILRSYLGEEVASTLTGDIVNAIFSAWAEESAASGADLGE